MPQNICKDERRRQDARDHERNGIDYVEVGRDQVSLTVFFFRGAPDPVHMRNFAIDTPAGARPVNIREVRPCRMDDPEREDCVRVFVDRQGDFSTYSLRVRDLENFDERFTSATFHFHKGKVAELDCKTAVTSLHARPPIPEIDYLAKDYDSFRRLMLDRLSLTMPGWNEQHVPDLGIVLVEILAYTADYLSYFQDAVATEAYLGTARKRISVRRHVRLLDYSLHEGCNARVWLIVSPSENFTVKSREIFFTTSIPSLLLPSATLIPESVIASAQASTFDVFEPLAPGSIDLYEGHNTIHFYSWGEFECHLPQGATSATLIDTLISTSIDTSKEVASGADHAVGPDSAPRPRALDGLKAGDYLLFEEIVGVMTGVGGDADPGKKQVVRLTHVRRHVDQLFDQPVVEIQWAAEDALTFSLILSTITPAPERIHIKHVSVARGNIILADHGRTLDTEEVLGTVGSDGSAFQPQLKKGNLTFRRTPVVGVGVPAVRALAQDPRQAIPQIHELTSTATQEEAGSARGLRWAAKQDLLESGSDDPDYVVEVDDDGVTNLRFGNGTLGRAPVSGSVFRAKYRAGNGAQGNVGAESIVHLITRAPAPNGLTITVRNPLPAHGGSDPEDIAKAKLLAPSAFRSTLGRAVTADDYAALAEQNPAVQRAAATLLWTGTRYVARVCIDPLGTEQADPELLESIQLSLQRYRRIGHDVVVMQAQYVPLLLAITVTVAPDYIRGHVESAVLQTLSDGILSDGTRGFFHSDNLSFGDDILISRIVAAVQDLAGVVTVSVTRLERLYDGPQGEIGSGLLTIKPLEVARLDNDPSHPENGVLQLTMRGGR